MKRKAHDAQPGDVFSNDEGLWMVREVSFTAKGTELLLAAGRTDSGEWFAFDNDAMLELWRPADEEGVRKVPQSVKAAVQAFEDMTRAEAYAERKRQAHRQAVLVMATDPEAESFQDTYHNQTEAIAKKYEEKSGQ